MVSIHPSTARHAPWVEHTRRGPDAHPRISVGRAGCNNVTAELQRECGFFETPIPKEGATAQSRHFNPAAMHSSMGGKRDRERKGEGGGGGKEAATEEAGARGATGKGSADGCVEARVGQNLLVGLASISGSKSQAKGVLASISSTARAHTQRAASRTPSVLCAR